MGHNYHYGVDWIFLLLVISTNGIAAATANSLSPDGKLARLYAVCMVGLIIIMGFFAGSRPSITLGILMLIYIVALFVLVRDNHSQLNKSLKTIEQLNQKNTDMKNVIQNAVSIKDTNTIAQEAMEQSLSASKKIDQLGQSASEIGQITDTIREVSDQTNLLALNAPVLSVQ